MGDFLYVFKYSAENQTSIKGKNIYGFVTLKAFAVVSAQKKNVPPIFWQNCLKQCNRS